MPRLTKLSILLRSLHIASAYTPNACPNCTSSGEQFSRRIAVRLCSSFGLTDFSYLERKTGDLVGAIGNHFVDAHVMACVYNMLWYALRFE